MRVTDQFYTPSLLLCLQDVILSYTLIKYCLKSYRSDYQDNTDPFLHPLMVDDAILKRMPKMLMVVGSSDPLRDDCIRYLKRYM